MNPIDWEGKTNSHRYEEKKLSNDQNSLFLKQIKSKMNILLFFSENQKLMTRI